MRITAPVWKQGARIRLAVLLALLAVVLCAAYFRFRRPPAFVRDLAYSIIPWRWDEFDTPFESDPVRVKDYERPLASFPLKDGDRVAWIGSSSTYIGEWTRTVEFLIRTRHPNLAVEFSTQSSGGGTFDTCCERLDTWLQRARPTIVFFNYGGNDANFGKSSWDTFRSSLLKAVEKTRAAGARAVIVTHQSGDMEAISKPLFYRRKRYAEGMLEVCRTQGLDSIDVHHALERLQVEGKRANSDFTINTDSIHLTDSAYVAWGFFFFEKLNPPEAESSLTIDFTSAGVTGANNCEAADIVKTASSLSFRRTDRVWPILPPLPVPSSAASRVFASESAHSQDHPPRQLVPLERFSKYMLRVVALPEGMYAIRCSGKPVGMASHAALAAGVNLNTLLLDSGNVAPWNDAALRVWNGERLEKVRSSLLFEVVPVQR